MPRYSDEAWEYIQDCKEKKIVGGNARNKKVHSGKRGGMKTASDYMTQKELRAMNGEVQTYRLGSPMNWEEFSRMPDDLKKMYIKKLRKNFNVPDENLANAMRVDISVFNDCISKLKLLPHNETWAMEEWNSFVAWWTISEEKK